jgi:hypothetical protein
MDAGGAGDGPLKGTCDVYYSFSSYPALPSLPTPPCQGLHLETGRFGAWLELALQDMH